MIGIRLNILWVAWKYIQREKDMYILSWQRFLMAGGLGMIKKKRKLIWNVYSIIGFAFLLFLVWKRSSGLINVIEGNSILYSLLNLLFLSLSVFIHELGHVCVARSYGAKYVGSRLLIVRKILPKISVSLFLTPNIKEREMIHILLGGILMPIYVCMIEYLLYPKLMKSMDAVIFVSLCNLIPCKIFNNDGYKIYLQIKEIRKEKSEF